MKPAFDNLADFYEAIIDWPKRLANEESFYRQIVAHAQAKSLLDVACGTGHHAALFHSWGLRVEGADVSSEMIARAQERFGQPDGLQWNRRAFDEPAPTTLPFDIVICTGNSLSLAVDPAAAERTVQHMLTAVRDGGAVVIHVLNLWALTDGPCLWQKFKRTCIGEEEILVIKGIHRSSNCGYVDLLGVPLSAASAPHTESIRFLGLEADQLEAWARRAGAADVRLYGSYQFQPYQREQSVDLIMVASKEIGLPHRNA
jgi:SAM-dependent methyltransferase